MQGLMEHMYACSNMACVWGKLTFQARYGNGQPGSTEGNGKEIGAGQIFDS